jgi:DNA helicase HerA-like ATPase
MDRKDFGVLYGQKTTDDSILIYSSYEDSKASPNTGDFIVLTPRDEEGTKYLARVEAEVYDEDPIFRSQDKTLVAVHFARIAERELSERDKQKIFSYTYNVRILGTFTSDGKDFTTAVRKLPTVGYHARYLSSREIENILNRENAKGAPIGHLCIGENVQEKEILFDVDKLRNNRTMIFAQSGFGKTNLAKVLLHQLVKERGYGKLIFDLNGEYFLRGDKTYGLGDINDTNIRENLVVFTDKDFPEKYKSRFNHAGKTKLNLATDLAISDFMQTAPGLTNAGRTFLEFVDSTPDNSLFLEKVFGNDDPKQIRQFAYAKFSSYFEVKEGEEKEPKQHLRAMLGGVIRQLKSLISVHDNTSNLTREVLTCLSHGKTVIIDLSLKDSVDASIISTILVRKLFENNKLNFTSASGEIINTVIFVEEAQNVLSEEFVKSNANPFVRVAKEGRKFGIGLIAVTQRPSAISDEIRTQADNFFAFHMGNSDDIKALTKSNVNYDGVIARFIQRETIKGNLYMVSSDQAFVLPLRVSKYEQLVEKEIYEDSKFIA